MVMLYTTVTSKEKQEMKPRCAVKKVDREITSEGKANDSSMLSVKLLWHFLGGGGGGNQNYEFGFVGPGSNRWVGPP